ncbi:MAG: M14 family metallocarboxypeptidase [archaeon]
MSEINQRYYEKEVVSRLNNLDSRLTVGTLGDVGSENNSYPVYFVKTAFNNGAKKVLLSAGVHGDEPAGIYAILDFLNGPILDYAQQYNFLIFPCLNPWGFEHNTRRNMNGVDINRSFVKDNSTIAPLLKKYVSKEQEYLFAMTLHEDNTDIAVVDFSKECNPKAFYMYESSLNGQRISLPIIKAVRQQGIELCDYEEIYGNKNQGGIIFVKSDNSEFEQFLESYTSNVLVIETPTCWPLEKRVSVQKLAFSTVLDSLKE